MWTGYCLMHIKHTAGDRILQRPLLFLIDVHHLVNIVMGFTVAFLRPEAAKPRALAVVLLSGGLSSTATSSLQSWLLLPISYPQWLVTGGLKASSAVLCLDFVLDNLQCTHKLDVGG